MMSQVLLGSSSDLAKIQESIYSLNAIIMRGINDIIATVDHSHDLLSSRSWTTGGGLGCIIGFCNPQHGLEEALYLDVRDVTDHASKEIIVAIAPVFHHLCAFEDRLLQLHRLASSDGVHINGTKPSIFRDLWLMASGDHARVMSMRNSKILDHTEKYIHATTLHTFEIIRMIHIIKSQSVVGQGTFRRRAVTKSGLQVVRKNAEILLKLNRIMYV
ncbi:hypothetical protein ONZ45_g17881 [Pleurotus djamor]|nr:hypothetical protein ONZ45_g17881 [Pleurotus djamor]